MTQQTMNRRYILVFFKIFVLLLCEVYVIHFTMYTVSDGLNPITLILLAYADSQMDKYFFENFPELIIFTIHSAISFFLLWAFFDKKQYKTWGIIYVICAIIQVCGCYIINRDYQYIKEMIDSSSLGNAYEFFYQYPSLSAILGFLAIQFLLLVIYGGVISFKKLLQKRREEH